MNIVLLWLTKRHLHSIGGKFIRVETINLPDEKTQEVVIYSGEKTINIGQATIFRTIIIHESVLLTKRLLNYVLLHEMQHNRQWYGYPIYPLIIISALVFSFFIFGAMGSLVFALIDLNPHYLVSAFLGLIIAAFSMLILGVFSWGLELNADFYAIKKIGIQEYLNALSDIPKRPKRPFYIQAVKLLTHPPNNIVIKLYNRFHKMKLS